MSVANVEERGHARGGIVSEGKESDSRLQIAEGLPVWKRKQADRRGPSHTGPPSFTHKFGVEKYLKIERVVFLVNLVAKSDPN